MSSDGVNDCPRSTIDFSESVVDTVCDVLIASILRLIADDSESGRGRGNGDDTALQQERIYIRRKIWGTLLQLHDSRPTPVDVRKTAS